MAIEFMPSGSFDDVPWEALFPEALPGDLALIRHAARAMDAARPASTHAKWSWFVDYAVFPGGNKTLLCASIPLYDNPGTGDSLEAELDAWRTGEGPLDVTAQMTVTSWCDQYDIYDHAAQLTCTVEGDVTVGQAFQTATDQMIAWLDSPHDPIWWRDQAGIPSPNFLLERRHSS